MIREPKIAILTSTYERSDLVVRNVKSVLSQEYKNWEIYLVNDGSQKDYSELEKLIEGHPQIKYHRFTENQGFNKVQNYCLSQILNSQCEYIMILDDDDQLAENALTLLAEAVLEYPDANWLAFNCQNISKSFTENVKLIDQVEYVEYPEEYNLKAHGDKAQVLKVDFVRKNPTIRLPKYIKNGCEDIFWLKLAKKTKVLLVNKTIKVIEYQATGLSSSSLYDYDGFEGAKKLFLYIVNNPYEMRYYRNMATHLGHIRYGKEFRKLLKNQLGSKYDKVKNYLKSK